MIGHSVGEFVAAASPGVFSLEDALRLVAARGAAHAGRCRRRACSRCARSGGPGRELAVGEVGRSPPSTRPTLASCRAQPEPIDAVARRARRHAASRRRRLATSHAFHSAMMDPIARARSRRGRATVPLPRPASRRLDPDRRLDHGRDEATDPGYWVRHLREPVRFADGLAPAARRPDARPARGRARPDAHELAQPAPGPRPHRIRRSLHCGTEDRALPTSSALLARRGQALDRRRRRSTGRVHARAPAAACALPTYPFERKRYWVDARRPSSRLPGAPPAPHPMSMETTAASASRRRADAGDRPAAARTGRPARRESSRARAAAARGSLGPRAGRPRRPRASFLELGLDSLFLTQASQVHPEGVRGEGHLPPAARGAVDDRCAGRPDRRADASPTGAPAQPALAPAPARGIAAPASPGARCFGRHRRPDAGGVRSARARVRASSSSHGPATRAARARRANVGSGRACRARPRRAPATQPATAAPARAVGAVPPRPTGRTGRSPGGASARPHAGAGSADARRFTGALRATDGGLEGLAAQHRPHLADPRAVAGFRRLEGDRLPDRGRASPRLAALGHRRQRVRRPRSTASAPTSSATPRLRRRGGRRAAATRGSRSGRSTRWRARSPSVSASSPGWSAPRSATPGPRRSWRACASRAPSPGADRSPSSPAPTTASSTRSSSAPPWTARPRSLPVAPGIPAATVENVLVLDYGTRGSLETIRERADDDSRPCSSSRSRAAGPTSSRGSSCTSCAASPSATDTALVFDEVITGFRVAPGGAQAYFGVEADLATYGKVIGGGLPIGVVAGRRALHGRPRRRGLALRRRLVPRGRGHLLRRHLRAPPAGVGRVGRGARPAGARQPRAAARPDFTHQGRWSTPSGSARKRAARPCASRRSARGSASSSPRTCLSGSLFFAYLREKGMHIWEGRPASSPPPTARPTYSAW